eukprot:1143655-Pelagomonas_calceolata.AAC.18
MERLPASSPSTQRHTERAVCCPRTPAFIMVTPLLRLTVRQLEDVLNPVNDAQAAPGQQLAHISCVEEAILICRSQ